MALFLLPPPHFIADTTEIPQQVLRQSESYQKGLLKELNVSEPIDKVTSGSYKGTQVYQWPQKYNAILLTTFLFQKGKGFKQEWAKTASLLRQEDCLHLASQWHFENKSTFSFSVENTTPSLSSALNRPFQKVSPIKIDLRTQFSDMRFAHLLNLFLLDEFSKNNIPILSNIGRFFCKIKKINNHNFEQKQVYPAEPHRLIEMNVTQIGEKNHLPLLTYQFHVNSGVFGHKNREPSEKKEKQEYDPHKIAQNIAQKINPLLHDLSQTQFKVIKRIGAWVYLNRGRAYGLNIGMRLVSENGAQLHIIRYEPNIDGEPDAAIAFIRYENKKTPLVVGDNLKIDQKIYPSP